MNQQLTSPQQPTRFGHNMKVNENKQLAEEMGVDEATLAELKKELRDMQKSGDAPDWYQTVGWQTVRNDYIWREGGETTIKQAFQRIAKGAAHYLPADMKHYEQKFFDLLWKGWLVPSSPVFANMGTGMGMAVSCSGSHIDDDLFQIYGVLQESAMLSKYGFGTSGNFSAIRSRGVKVKGTGGKSSGIMAWVKSYKQMIEEVTQGKKRRGAFAGYINIDHGDFYDLMHWYKSNHDKFNLGLNISQAFIDRCKAGDEDAIKRRSLALELRRVIGSPYLFYIDKANNASPQKFKDLGLTVKASNLCTEITLPADKDHSYSCVLSSMNGYLYDEWENTDAVETAIVFLDCIAEDLIVRGASVQGLEKVVRFTRKARALGLGVLGYHSFLQKKMVPFESLEAQLINSQMFKKIQEQATAASKMLGEKLGIPEWCSDMRNATLIAIAPNTTSAHMAGSISQGIEPWVGNYFIQPSSKGQLLRINPHFVDLLKAKKRYSKEVLESVRDANGSCQHLDFLSDLEKQVFRTAYELDQMVILRQAEQRQRYICQGQSLNLFFPKADDNWTPSQVSDFNQYMDDCHSYADQSPTIKALYYVRSQAGMAADTGRSNECIACGS